LTGWTIVSGSVDLVGSSYWPAFSGVQSIDLDGDNAGTISQTFATTPGSTYKVGFWYSNNTGTSATVGMHVSVVDSSATPLTLFGTSVTHQGATNSNMNYIDDTGTFTADTTSSTLTFASTDSPGSDQGIALDAVSVTATGTSPEPSSLALLALVLPCGAGLVRRGLRPRN